jgi:hypothetical protein
MYIRKMLIFNWIGKCIINRKLFVYLFKFFLFYEEYFLGEISGRREN